MTSCSDYFEKEINADLPNEKSQLAVSAILRTDTILKRLFVNRTVDILKDIDYGVEDYSNTEVTLSDGTNTIAFDYDQIVDTIRFGPEPDQIRLSGRSFNFSNDDYFPFEVGKKYTLKVQRDGYETAIAETEVLPSVAIESFSLIKIGLNENVATYDLRMRFKEVPTEKKYYKVRFVELEGFYRYPYFYDNDYTVSNTPSIDDNAILVSTDLIDEDTKSINMTLRANEITDEDFDNTLQTKIYVAEVSKERADYEKKVHNILESTDNPFISPLILPTNFIGGLGYFSIENGQVYWVSE